MFLLQTFEQATGELGTVRMREMESFVFQALVRSSLADQGRCLGENVISFQRFFRG